MRARTTVTLPRTRAFPGGTIPGILLLGDLTWIEQAFGPALVRLHRDGTARVAAAVTPSGKPAPWMAREFPRLRGAAHLDVLDEPPDTLALIATPLRQRPAKITHALRRGWHVLSACPPAESAAETEKLCELARRNEVSLSVDLPHRLSPWFRWLRLIAGGRALGGCFTFRMEEGGEDIGPGEVPPLGAWLDPGLRAFDLIADWFGGMQPLSAADDALGGVEAVARAEFAMTAGFHGSLRLDRDRRLPPSYLLRCRRGTVHWDSASAKPIRLEFEPTADALVGVLEGPEQDRNGVLAETRELQLRQLFGAVIRGNDPANHATTLLPALAMADQCRRIRSSLPLPWFSANESAVAASLSLHGRAA